MSFTAPLITLNDGNQIPQIGLGVWQATPEQTAKAVRDALLAGYRHVDTASLYKNEAGVGAGFRESGLPREDVFITTKVWNDAQGNTLTRESLSKSLELLKLDYVDLFLIHWPAPPKDLFIETWYALIDLKKQGLARSIGVSNFTEATLNRLVNETGVLPVLNQIELHPYLQQENLRNIHTKLGIKTECWSPLAKAQAMEETVIKHIAAKYGKTPAQVILRWHVENGCIAIPKSITPSRIQENIQIFDFQLDSDDMSLISGLNQNARIGPDPETFE